MGWFDSVVESVSAPVRRTIEFVNDPNINTLGKAALSGEEMNMKMFESIAQTTPNKEDDDTVQSVSDATVGSKDVQNAAGWTAAVLGAYYGGGALMNSGYGAKAATTAKYASSAYSVYNQTQKKSNAATSMPMGYVYQPSVTGGRGLPVYGTQKSAKTGTSASQENSYGTSGGDSSIASLVIPAIIAGIGFYIYRSK